MLKGNVATFPFLIVMDRQASMISNFIINQGTQHVPFFDGVHIHLLLYVFIIEKQLK